MEQTASSVICSSVIRDANPVTLFNPAREKIEHAVAGDSRSIN